MSFNDSLRTDGPQIADAGTSAGPSKLTSSDVAELEHQLRSMRVEVIDALRTRLAGAESDQPRSLDNPAGEGDGAVDATFAETDIALVRHELDALRDIDDALKRIEFHVAGICTECGAAIPIARLRAVPTAATCMACAAATDATART